MLVQSNAVNIFVFGSIVSSPSLCNFCTIASSCPVIGRLYRSIASKPPKNAQASIPATWFTGGVIKSQSAATADSDGALIVRITPLAQRNQLQSRIDILHNVLDISGASRINPPNNPHQVRRHLYHVLNTLDGATQHNPDRQEHTLPACSPAVYLATSCSPLSTIQHLHQPEPALHIRDAQNHWLLQFRNDDAYKVVVLGSTTAVKVASGNCGSLPN